MRAYTKFEIVLGFVILILLVGYSASLTKKSFIKAEETFNKNQIFKIEEGLKTLINNSDDLTKTFATCQSNFCEVNQNLLQTKFLNNELDPPVQLIPKLPRTNDGKNFSLKIRSGNSYVIQGRSAVSADLCWIIDSDSSNSNTSKDQPTPCLKN